MIARVKGVFERYQAEVAFYPDDSSTASVRFYIDAASVTTRYNLRDEHLKSDLLLHVEEHPYITFESSGFHLAVTLACLTFNIPLESGVEDVVKIELSIESILKK
ncbi:YceI family protein [Paenibacillus filicis]|uniref:YceI family protein n=1 Tax=Paenibacillus gyeongsangnamensis TaxID=3388067 RepID=A0ABT4QK25_9BACL|nr:YceI family protein [Paenibacillus filicis]MCZ8517224.1 YceI family protein [Paenibacillus filicis]